MSFCDCFLLARHNKFAGRNRAVEAGRKQGFEVADADTPTTASPWNLRLHRNMASRAEARRAAILARGSDRLAKLTTSARGEDHPAYQVHEKLHKGPSAASDGTYTLPNHPRLCLKQSSDPPLPTIMPTGQNDAFSQAQQQQFIQALMNGDAPAMPANGMAGESPFLTPNPGEDPLAAMMARFAPIEAGAQTGSTAVRKPAPWWLPLIHILSTLSLVAYFTLFTPGGIWTANQTWMDKIRQYSGSSTVGVPFFALFMALQVALHSLRIIFGFVSIPYSIQESDTEDYI